jgi:hypothetical protein
MKLSFEGHGDKVVALAHIEFVRNVVAGCHKFFSYLSQLPMQNDGEERPV